MSDAPSSKRATWKRDARELARPALTYLAWVLVMLGVFDLVILATEGFSAGNFGVLAVLSFSTIVGVGIGQAMAIARPLRASPSMWQRLRTQRPRCLSPRASSRPSGLSRWGIRRFPCASKWRVHPRRPNAA